MKGLRRPSSEWPDRHRKAAVTAMTTGDPSVFGNGTAVMRDTIVQPSAPAEILRYGGLDAPLNFPIPRRTGIPTGYWTEEGRPRPISRSNFEGVTLTGREASIYLTFSRDLMRHGGEVATSSIIGGAQEQMPQVLDTAFFSTAAATASTPGGILENAIGFSGGSPAGEPEVTNAVAVVSDGNPRRPVWFTSLRALAYLASFAGNTFRDARIGGSILGIPLVISAAAGNRLILVDGADVAVHLGDLQVDASDEAAIEMADTTTPGGASLVSLWQTNSVSVRLSITASWALLSDDAVSYVELTELGASPA
jgi:hypothetical protein